MKRLSRIGLNCIRTGTGAPLHPLRLLPLTRHISPRHTGFGWPGNERGEGAADTKPWGFARLSSPMKSER